MGLGESLDYMRRCCNKDGDSYPLLQFFSMMLDESYFQCFSVKITVYPADQHSVEVTDVRAYELNKDQDGSLDEKSGTLVIRDHNRITVADGKLQIPTDQFVEGWKAFTEVTFGIYNDFSPYPSAVQQNATTYPANAKARQLQIIDEALAGIRDRLGKTQHFDSAQMHGTQADFYELLNLISGGKFGALSPKTLSRLLKISGVFFHASARKGQGRAHWAQLFPELYKVVQN